MYDVLVDFELVRDLTGWDEELRNQFFAFVEELAQDPWGKADKSTDDVGSPPYTWYRTAKWQHLQAQYIIFDDGGFNTVTITAMESRPADINYD